MTSPIAWVRWHLLGEKRKFERWLAEAEAEEDIIERSLYEEAHSHWPASRRPSSHFEPRNFGPRNFKL